MLNLQSALLPELDANSLLRLFQAIPESLPSSELTVWLTESMLPCALQHVPEFMVQKGLGSVYPV